MSDPVSMQASGLHEAVEYVYQMADWKIDRTVNR